jgi:hypothetical protein
MSWSLKQIFSRLDQWAQLVGLKSEGATEFQTTYADHPFVISVAIDALLEIGSLLQVRKNLLRGYGLSIPEHPHFQAGPERTETIEGLQTLFTMGTEQWQLQRRQLLVRNQKEYNILSRLTWSIKDKKRFQELVTQLRLLIDGLEAVTLSFAQIKTQELFMIQALPSTRANLELIWQNVDFSEQFRAAAKFKAQHSAGSPPPDNDLVLRNQGFTFYPQSSGTRPGMFELAQWNSGNNGGQWILVENKRKSPIEFDPESRAILERRLRDLAAILHQRPKPYGYRVLDLLGYIKSHPTSQTSCQLIFEIPSACRGSSERPGLKTLYDLLRPIADTTPPTAPLLGDRFRLAQYLATCVLCLHLTGWLHRSLSSSTVVCFSPDASRDSILYPYLQGFAFAHTDDAMEISEVDTLESARLYRHPRYQAGEKYRRSFEYYSLGVILLEIGWWRRIDAFWKPTYTPEQFQRRLLERHTDPLGHLMGENYRNAVRTCLGGSAAFGVGDNEGRQISQSFFQKVVRVLDAGSA